MCVLLEHCVESVCVSGSNVKDEPIEFGTTNVKLESFQLIKACENALKIVQNLVEDNNVSTITHKVAIFLHIFIGNTRYLQKITGILIFLEKSLFLYSSIISVKVVHIRYHKLMSGYLIDFEASLPLGL